MRKLKLQMPISVEGYVASADGNSRPLKLVKSTAYGIGVVANHFQPKSK